MYARSTTIQAQPSAIDTGVAHIRDEVMPALQEIDGYVGVSLLVDRQSGRCIATTAWQTEEAMQASAERVRPIRDRAAEVFGGSVNVEEWDVAVLHRDHRSGDDACVYAMWLEADPAQEDRNIELYKVSAVPALEQLEGFCSASLLLHRPSGRAVSCTTYDSVEAMERNRDQARAIKHSGLQEAGIRQLDEGEFELAVAHLRVPESA